MTGPSRPATALRLILSSLLLGLARVAAADEPPIAHAPAGPVQGITTPIMHKFLGIPYALPPVGALRWAPPQPRAPWTTPLDATSFGNRCPQGPSAIGRSSTAEDCL